MKKQVRRFNVPFDFDWTDGVEIKKIKEDLNELEKLGATTIDIEPQEFYGSLGVGIEAYFSRLETDEECKSRINGEERHKEYLKQRDLKELERIKSKYGI